MNTEYYSTSSHSLVSEFEQASEAQRPVEEPKTRGAENNVHLVREYNETSRPPGFVGW